MDAEKTEVCPEDYNVKNLILYKMDRTMAIAGLIIIGIVSIVSDAIPPEAAKVVTGVVGALAVYVGGRGRSK